MAYMQPLHQAPVSELLQMQNLALAMAQKSIATMQRLKFASFT
jgi:hypothetical protein